MDAKIGDVVRVVRTIKRENVWAIGVLIRHARSHGSDLYYDVLIDGAIELTHEMNIKNLNYEETT